ncbi:MAG: MobA/MobL family protein [Hyphomicrobiales bacterium]
MAKAAYNSGQSLRIEREDRTTTLPVRRDVLHTAVITPKGAPPWVTARASLWNAVENAVKRKDGRLAKEVVVAITRGIPPEQWPQLAADYVKSWVEDGQIADLAIHEDGSLHNPHLHVLLSVHALQPNGFGRKLPNVDHKAFVKTARTRWADLTNAYLKANGHSVRVDARSYKARGIAAQPTQHRGPNPAERRARRAHVQAFPTLEPGAVAMSQEKSVPPAAERRWFEQRNEQSSARPEEPPVQQPLPDDDMAPLNREEAELRQLIVEAPEPTGQALIDEIAYQRRLAELAEDRAQRLDFLHERLDPEQRVLLERYLNKQRQYDRDYPLPEPGPDGQPMSPSDLDRARQAMQAEHEREEPER